MQLKPKDGLILVVGVALGLAVGIAISGGESTTPAPASNGDQQAALQQAKQAVRAEYQGQLQEARDEVVRLEATAARQEAELQRRPVATGAGEPVPQPEAAAEVARLKAENTRLKEELAQAEQPPDVSGPGPEVYRFGLEGETPVFDAVEWTEVGSHMQALQTILVDLRAELEETGEISMRTRSGLMEHNMPLAALAIQLGKDEVEGSGPNGAFTHPVVIGNLVRAILEDVGDPLTDAQDAALRQAGEEWVAAETSRHLSYTERTLALQRVMDEVDTKLAFMEQIRDLLSPSQEEVVSDPRLDDRSGLDLFSPGLIYTQRTPVVGNTVEQLERRLVEQLFQGLDISQPVDDYLWLGKRWLEAFPDATFPIPQDQYQSQAMFPLVQSLQQAARAQVLVMQEVRQAVALDADQLKALRETELLLVPQVLEPQPESTEGG